MEYYAYIEQKGEGCSYTIGCGYCFFKLESKDKESALKELKSKIIDKWDEELNEWIDEKREFCLDDLETISLIEANSNQLVMDYLKKEYYLEQGKYEKYRLELEEQEQRKQYELLKEKFKK